MDIWKEVEKRFREAITKYVKPPVLIGDRWFQVRPEDKQAPFRFVGTSRIAKGTGNTVAWAAELLLRRVRLDDLHLEAAVGEKGVIQIGPARPKSKSEATGQSGGEDEPAK